MQTAIELKECPECGIDENEVHRLEARVSELEDKLYDAECALKDSRAYAARLLDGIKQSRVILEGIPHGSGDGDVWFGIGRTKGGLEFLTWIKP